MPLKVGFDLIALPEAESGPRVENFISEDDRFVEHDERKIGAGDGSTDTSSSSVWQRDIRRSQIPVLPGTSLGSPGLEHEPTASTQDVNDGSQRAVPVLVRHEHLRHIAGHHDEVVEARVTADLHQATPAAAAVTKRPNRTPKARRARNAPGQQRSDRGR